MTTAMTNFPHAILPDSGAGAGCLDRARVTWVNSARTIVIIEFVIIILVILLILSDELLWAKLRPPILRGELLLRHLLHLPFILI